MRTESADYSLDPSGHARKGLGNNLARKCLAGMPRFLNPANFIFRSSTRLSGTTPIFKISMLYRISLPVISRTRTLVG